MARIPVDEAWAWWTDYGEAGDEQNVTHGLGTSRRRILEKTGTHIVLEEDLPLPFGAHVPLVRHEVDIEAGARTIREHGTRPHEYDSRWYFEPGSTGNETRITRVMEIPAPALDELGPLAEDVVRRFITKDLEHHVGEMMADSRP